MNNTKIRANMHNEEFYIKKFLDPLKVCEKYKPKFGKGTHKEGLDLDQFISLYNADPFYSWCGLNSNLMYSAHKAAGGITSIYRQIGKGCENLFKEILFSSLEYRERIFVEWSYKSLTKAGKEKTLSLDGRIFFSEIRNSAVKQKVINWTQEYCEIIKAKFPNNGIVFEVRQGYKSKDSKRQNGDIDNIAVAWSQDYLPVFAIFSGQIDNELVLRYKNSRGGVIVGNLSSSPYESLFIFCKEILNYDLEGFFCRNTSFIKKEMHHTLEALLDA
ncbi:MAG: hypothetical protein LBK06_09685 [Planctomycetaceae bacterium]|nr:hypothetical protein [Planctomycetaceae bacterium]